MKAETRRQKGSTRLTEFPREQEAGLEQATNPVQTKLHFAQQTPALLQPGPSHTSATAATRTSTTGVPSIEAISDDSHPRHLHRSNAAVGGHFVAAQTRNEAHRAPKLAKPGSASAITSANHAAPARIRPPPPPASYNVNLDSITTVSSLKSLRPKASALVPRKTLLPSLHGGAPNM